VDSEQSSSAPTPAPSLLDAIADPVAVFDGAGRLERVNPAFAEVAGHDDGSAPTAAAVFADPERVRETVAAVPVGGETTFDATVVAADGEERVYEFTAATHAADGGEATDGRTDSDAGDGRTDSDAGEGRTDSDAGEGRTGGDAGDGRTDSHAADGSDRPTEPGAAVVCVGRDVTAARERDRERAQYEAILESLSDAVYAIESDGTIAYVNRTYAEMKGVPREELVGTDIDGWVTEETVERADEMRAELAAGERDVATVEYEFVTADGERFPAELRFGEVEDDAGGLARAGMIRDVTERAERERTLEERNEQLTEFASIVSHDLRNPLNVAAGRLELARDDCDSEHLDGVERAHDRMRSMIEELLTLAREGRTDGDRGSVSLREVAERSWQAVDDPNARLVVESDPVVGAEEGQLRRLLDNLFRNSVEHGSTSPHSETREDAPDPDDADAGVTVRVGGLPDGFFVEDDGPGIDPADHDDVFEAGFTTSPEGTGFGLRVVGSVAEAHGWDVHLTDGRDGGARFEFRGVETR
jgi:PAS domain S-box-containing protein